MEEIENLGGKNYKETKWEGNKGPELVVKSVPPKSPEPTTSW